MVIGERPLYVMDPDPEHADKTFKMSSAEREELDSLKCGTEKENQKYGRKHTRRCASLMCLWV